MDEMTRISHSRVRAWRRCHKLHDYRYNQRLKPRVKPLPMKRGSMVAHLLELHYSKPRKNWVEAWKDYKADYDKLFEEEQELYGDLPGDTFLMVERYLDYYADDGLDYVSVEHKYEFEYQGLMIVGKLDAVVRDKNGKIWLLERKVPKSMPDEDARFSDLQTVLYYHIHKLCNGVPPAGILWDYIRAKLPVVPEPLKSGEMSKRNIDTDEATYRQALIDNDLDPADYAEFLASLEGREENFMRRVYLPRPSKQLVDQVWSDFVSTGFEIDELGTVLKDRNPQRDCKRCEMYRLCRLEAHGEDASFTRAKDFTVGEEHEEEGSQEEGDE